MNPLISIVILNHNGLKYLNKTIPLLLKLGYPNCEIIVVDNDSKDESFKFLAKFKKIKIIKNSKNLGYSKGKNIGIKNAKGEYVLLLDDDILIKNGNILEDLLKEYNRLEAIGFLSILLKQNNETTTTLYGGFINYLNFYKNKKIEINKIVGHETFESAGPDGGAIFFKKNFFLKIGMFDESQPYYIDAGDIGLRAIIMGYKNYVYCKDYFIHLGRIRKESNKNWCWKYKYSFSGLTRIVFKNFRFINLIIYSSYLFLFFVLKTIKHIIKRMNLCVFSAFVTSFILFLKNFPDTLKQRKIIFNKRVIKADLFLHITPPQRILKSEN